MFVLTYNVHHIDFKNYYKWSNNCFTCILSGDKLCPNFMLSSGTSEINKLRLDEWTDGYMYGQVNVKKEKKYRYVIGEIDE